MSLPSEYKDLLRPPLGNRGRSQSDRSLSPGNASPSRFHSPSRSRGRSANASRSRSKSRRHRVNSQDESNFKWSILNRDPSERFQSNGTAEDNESQESAGEVSEEELISDEEGDYQFDINEVKLPNFNKSINQYYKTRAVVVGSMTFDKEDEELKKKQEDERLRKQKKEEDIKRKQRDQELAELSERLNKISDALSLAKAFKEAKTSENEISEETLANLSQKMKEVGISDPETIKIEVVEELENQKEKIYTRYKQKLMEKSANEGKEAEVGLIKDITKSELNINEERKRVSRSITLGPFFKAATGKRVKDIDSYLIYVNGDADSTNALQYSIGSVVKSGDVLYVVTSNEKVDVDQNKQTVEKLTKSIKCLLEIIRDPDFTLHITIEATYHEYPRNFVNELIKYLKPTLFIIGQGVLKKQLENYISNIPVLIITKKFIRRRSIT